MSVIKPVNDYTVHGRPVAYARIRDVDDGQGIVICDLLNVDDQVLAADRYFPLDRAPFEISSSDRVALGVPPLAPGLPPSFPDAKVPDAKSGQAGQAPDASVGTGESSAQEGPDDSWRKDDIMAWLEAQEIPYSRGDNKAVLLEKIAKAGESENG